ncbi:MAG: hypothetical protein AB8B48_19310 [Pseudomonadales bacterium]
MPEQLMIAIALLCLLFIIEYVLGLLPGDPFKSIKITGNVVRFQRSAMSRQYSVQKGSVRRVIITPGHISMKLDENYGNKVLNLNFERGYSQQLHSFLAENLSNASFEFIDARQDVQPTATAKPFISLVE